MVYLKFGINNLLFFKYLVLSAFLIPIFFIDLFNKLILNVLSIPLIALGLIFSLMSNTDVQFINALISGAFVSVMLLAVTYLYAKSKGAIGLGGGDILLLTAIAVFYGALSTPYILFFSTILAIFYFLIFIRKRDVPFVFGPFIVVVSIAWFMVGESFLQFLLTSVL